MANIPASEFYSPESRLLKLFAYLDCDGIILVGGCLKNAPISPEARHPAVLDPKHLLTKLFIR